MGCFFFFFFIVYLQGRRLVDNQTSTKYFWECILLIQKNLFFNVYSFFWETERDRAQVEEEQREREGGRESEAGSRLRAVSTEPDVGLELTTCEIMTWAEVGHSTDWATQAPKKSIFNMKSRGVWVAQSVKRPTSAQVMISQFVSLSPTSGSVLTAQSLEPASASVSPSLPAPPLLMLCLSLSQK